MVVPDPWWERWGKFFRRYEYLGPIGPNCEGVWGYIYHKKRRKAWLRAREET